MYNEKDASIDIESLKAFSRISCIHEAFALRIPAFRLQTISASPCKYDVSLGQISKNISYEPSQHSSLTQL
jgi:hypothetical protein